MTTTKIEEDSQKKLVGDNTHQEMLLQTDSGEVVDREELGMDEAK